MQNSTGPTHKQQVQKFGGVAKTGGVIGEHISRHWILEGLKELNFITNIDMIFIGTITTVVNCVD